MPEVGILGIILSVTAGGIVGLVFFGGLWLSVKSIPTAKNPAAFMLLSFVARIAVFVAAFYAIAKWGNWAHLVIALASALIVRSILIRTIGKGAFEKESKVIEEKRTETE
ncbi:MAG: ATP synthase subunit I [bacterium]